MGYSSRSGDRELSASLEPKPISADEKYPMKTQTKLRGIVLALLASIGAGCGGEGGGDVSPADVAGTWTVTDECSSSGAASYVVTATALPSGLVEFGNFYDTFFLGTLGSVSGRTVTIARQNPGGTPLYIEGSGTVNAAGNTISWSYTFSDESTPGAIVTDVCTATFTK